MFLGILLPLIFAFSNMVLNYASVLPTIAALVWSGFGLILLSPAADPS